MSIGRDVQDLEPNFWIDATGDVVAQIADHTAILSFESQEMFAERFLPHAWSASLAAPVEFAFHTEPASVFAPSHVGSVAEDLSWLWGWHNINGFDDAVVDAVNGVFHAGETTGVDELRVPLLPTDEGERAAAGLPWRADGEGTYVAVTQALSLHPAPVWFRIGGDDGVSRSYAVLRNDDVFTLPPATSWSVTHAISHALAAGAMTNHRLAVHAYADRRGGVEFAEAIEQRYVLQTADSSVVVEFDELDRVAGISATLPAP